MTQLITLAGEAAPGMDTLSVRDLGTNKFNAALFERVLRTLNRKCAAGDQRLRFASFVKTWVENKGKLPDGLRPMPARSGAILEDVNGTEEDAAPSPVPGHRVLQATFTLKSKAFMLTHNSRGFTRDGWPAYRSWAERVGKLYGARAWAVCWEQSLDAATSANPAAEVFHGHCYFIWTDGVGIRLENLEPLEFQHVRPRVDRCHTKTNNDSPRVASLRGLWYVTVMKKGTVDADTNYTPFRDYRPLASWLEGLWSNQKLGHAEFLAMSAQLRVGHANRKRDAMEVMRQEREGAVVAHVDKEKKGLEKLSGFHAYPALDKFWEAHSNTVLRRPILSHCRRHQFGQE